MEPITVTAEAEGFTCNAYLVPGETTTLVDVGTMAGVESVVAERLGELEREDDVDREDDIEREDDVDREGGLDRVVLTHQHADHIGELDAVLDAFDPELCAYGEHPRRDRALADGDTVQIGDEHCEVVYTPGHASDHVSFVGETNLFSGDVVVYNDGAFENGSFGRTDMAGQSRDRLISSLRTLLDRLPDSVEAMYAGHGNVYRAEEGPDTIREVLERALERAERREPKYPDE